MQELARSGHTVFRCSLHCPKVCLKSEGSVRFSIHYTADPSSSEMLLKTFIAVNQLGPRPAILLSQLGVTIVCREYTKLREDLKAET